MENVLHGELREKPSKGENNRLRNNGRIPGVMYGLKNPNFLVEFGESEIFDVLKHPSKIVNVEVNGDNKKAIFKEIQRDSVTNKIIHVDLQMVDDYHRIHAKVPVKILGEDMLRRNGAMAQVQVTEVEVEGTADRLPKFIQADLSRIPVGGRLTLGNLEVSEEIAVVGDPNTIVAAISYIKEMPVEEQTPDEAIAIHSEEITTE